MTATIDSMLGAFEARLKASPLTSGFTLWTGALRQVAAKAFAQRDAQNRAAYGQIMLAESQLKALRSDLADSPVNASPAPRRKTAYETVAGFAHELEAMRLPPESEAPASRSLAAIDSILEKLYAAKGALCALCLLGIVFCELTPAIDDDPERRRAQRVLRVKGRKIEEIPLC